MFRIELFWVIFAISGLVLAYEIDDNENRSGHHGGKGKHNNTQGGISENHNSQHGFHGHNSTEGGSSHNRTVGERRHHGFHGHNSTEGGSSHNHTVGERRHHGFHGHNITEGGSSHNRTVGERRHHGFHGYNSTEGGSSHNRTVGERRHHGFPGHNSTEGGTSGEGSNESHNEGGHSGNRNCSIVATGTTTCAGAAALAQCSNSTYLLAQAATSTSVTTCSGTNPTPVVKSIQFRLRNAEDIRGSTCFTVLPIELRTCSVLNGDATFVKNSCTDQANLKNIALANTSVRICVVRRNTAFSAGTSSVTAFI